MKKIISVLLLLACAISLCACQVEVHWFDKSTYVPWYVVYVPVVIFIVIVLVAAQICITRISYKCPKCGNIFKPKWYEFSSWIHMGSSRIMRCPLCKHKGFCHKHNE